MASAPPSCLLCREVVGKCINGASICPNITCYEQYACSALGICPKPDGGCSGGSPVPPPPSSWGPSPPPSSGSYNPVPPSSGTPPPPTSGSGPVPSPHQRIWKRPISSPFNKRWPNPTSSYQWQWWRQRRWQWQWQWQLFRCGHQAAPVWHAQEPQRPAEGLCQAGVECRHHWHDSTSNL